MQQTLLPESRNASQNNLMFFMMLIALFFLVHSMMNPPQKRDREEQAVEKKQLDEEDFDENDADPEQPDAEERPVAPEIEQAKVEPGWVTLGSMDPSGPYRMLVTLTNKGAAVTRIELNEDKYRDVQDHTGYLGQIVADLNELGDFFENGCLVQVVGPGTPAEKAGLRVNDRIVAFAQTLRGKRELTPIHGFNDLRTALLKTRPGETIELEVYRNDNHSQETSTAAEESPEDAIEAVPEAAPTALEQAPITLKVVLGQSPLNIVRPLGTMTTFEQYDDLRGLHGYDEYSHDQLSYLCTLSTIDQQHLPLPDSITETPTKHKDVVERDESLNRELREVRMRKGLWELVESSEEKAVYRMILPKWKLEVFKTFRLAKKDDPTDLHTQGKLGAYHLNVEIAVRNHDSKSHTVAYMLDGPTGMPLEGAWYPRKTGPGWSGYGIRDLVVKFDQSAHRTIGNTTIANDKFNAEPWKGDRLDYVGVDTQYFQSTLMPKGEEEGEIWHARTFPIRVGEHNVAWSNLTDISFRIYSEEVKLKPGLQSDSAEDGDTSGFTRSYTVFAGPKNRDVLAVYGLENTIAYGWFWFVAIPMLMFLHFIKNYVVFHYGLAIILLTVCVRLLMFPLSRKQAINAVKQAKLAPEMQKIKEKYKNDTEAQLKAQRELWKKHKFNPMSGCLGIFVQLPVFIGLYKTLSIDVELYGAPLISKGFRWCSDLSAPDMLINWSGIWNSIGWTSFNTGQGMIYLGPYFNLLPMLTIALMMVQQALLMPPATDENTRMQQNMMKYMMIFMGLFFFKVPSGLCVYFTVSTLWGLAERKLIPKYDHSVEEEASEVAAPEKRYESKSEKKSEKDKKSKSPVPSEKEQMGTLGEMWKKITEKASEPQRLEKSVKKRKKKKK